MLKEGDIVMGVSEFSSWAVGDKGRISRVTSVSYYGSQGTRLTFYLIYDPRGTFQTGHRLVSWDNFYELKKLDVSTYLKLICSVKTVDCPWFV